MVGNYKEEITFENDIFAEVNSETASCGQERKSSLCQRIFYTRTSGESWESLVGVKTATL